MDKRYNEIVLLVHPLYDATFTSFDVSITKKHIEAISNPNTKNKQLRKELLSQIKKTLGIYGDFLNKFVNKKETGIIFYSPRDDLEVSTKEKKIIKQSMDVYTKVLTPFLNHYTALFNERLYISDYHSLFPHITKPIISKEMSANLDKEINLIMLGEYYNSRKGDQGCVYNLKQNFIKYLESNNTQIKKISLIKERILSFKSEGLIGFRKAVLPKHQRRKLVQTEKKAKLKKNQFLKMQV